VVVVAGKLAEIACWLADGFVFQGQAVKKPSWMAGSQQHGSVGFKTSDCRMSRAGVHGRWSRIDVQAMMLNAQAGVQECALLLELTTCVGSRHPVC
jgi:hypothetical protein